MIPIEGVVWFSNDETALGRGITGVDGLFSVKPVWVYPCSWAPTMEANTTSLYWKKEGYRIPPGQADSSLSHDGELPPRPLEHKGLRIMRDDEVPQASATR